MKQCEVKSGDFPLRTLVEIFLEEQFYSERLTIAGVSSYYSTLAGSQNGLGSFTGFVSFLERSGKASPTLKYFNEKRVAFYCEFVMQYYGCIHWEEASKALKAFWDWCHARQMLSVGTMPADLKYTPAVDSRVQIQVSLSSPPFRSRRL